MNRLILIGNGFDLAHGMKTSYNDFVLWYLKKCFSEAWEKNSYADELLKIGQIVRANGRSILPFENTSEMINFFYKTSFELLLYGGSTKIKDYGIEFQNPFSIETKSNLISKLITKCSNSNWVDIENEFYEELKGVLSMTDLQKINYNFAEEKLKKLKSLNESLSFIIEQLGLYLKQLDQPELCPDYSRIFSSPIYRRELCTKIIEADEKANNTVILNFNYTNTPEKYLEDEITDFKVNYIHGTIEDPKSLVFGFGDELDEDYKKLELQKSNAFFEYIKSFWYFKDSKYHNLVRFIDGDEFQVYILGHSCGLSDRTMLNMIFEHEKCKSIKIFYHGTKEHNNYTNLTQEISRHFKDKLVMRKKIVPFDKSEPMPQVESKTIPA